MTMTEANVAVLTRAELGALHLMLGAERSTLTEALAIPTADEREIAEAGVASLIARGLVTSEDGELVVEPMTAAAGVAVAEAQRCVALVGIRDEPVAVARLVESDGVRMALVPLPPRNVGFSLLDADVDFVEALAGVAMDMLETVSQVGIAVEIDNGAAVERSVLLEQGAGKDDVIATLAQLALAN